MPRALLAGIVWIGLSALSCSVVGDGPGALPPLAAAPAESRTLEAPPPDPAMRALVEFLHGRRTGLTPVEIESVARTILLEARRNDLDPTLILAVMHVESRFRNFVRSPVGALGLMQIMPSTGKELAAREQIPWSGPQTLFDPNVNVRLGTRYLRELSDRYGSIPTALAAYNWGPAKIDRRLRRGTGLPEQYPRLVLEAQDAHVGRSS